MVTRTPVIELQNVKKQIGKAKIIHGITLDIFPGEVFGFLGPNGAGKTTTIRMMVGLMAITEGDILINGYSIQKHFEKAITYVGGIIENPEMYKFLSGYNNLVHYARMVPKEITKQRIDEVVKLVGLEKRIHEKVKGYSLGMRQRLGVAQALLHSPSLLILDEPTNGLDPAGIREIRMYIRKVAQEENIAVFVSSHMLSEMQLMCDRIGIIQNGKLLSVETVGNLVRQSDQVSATFEVTPVEEAYSFIKENFSQMESKMTDNKIEVFVQKDDIPAMNEALVSKDFKVYGITLSQKTLEDKFLELTEDK